MSATTASEGRHSSSHLSFDTAQFPPERIQRGALVIDDWVENAAPATSKNPALLPDGLTQHLASSGMLQQRTRPSSSEIPLGQPTSSFPVSWSDLTGAARDEAVLQRGRVIDSPASPRGSAKSIGTASTQQGRVILYATDEDEDRQASFAPQRYKSSPTAAQGAALSGNPQGPATEIHTVLRAHPEVKSVEKKVTVPVVKWRERIEEVFQRVVHEKVVEVPEVHQVELCTEKPIVHYEEVETVVENPTAVAVEKIFEVPVVCRQEVLVEVPQVQNVELLTRVPKPRLQSVAKHVKKPVIEVSEGQVLVPQVTLKERLVEVPKVQEVEVVREVLCKVPREVEKTVPVPVAEFVDAIEQVAIVEKHDRIIEVPIPEVREIIVQVPKLVVEYVDRDVRVPQVQYVEKVVEVPQVVYQERIIEVPKVVQKEIIKRVPKPVVQYVDKKVPKMEMEYYEVIQEVPIQLVEESILEVPHNKHVELVTQIPKTDVIAVGKEIPRVKIQPQEVIQEVPLVTQQERLVEVPQVQSIDTITEVVKPQVQVLEKSVPRFVVRAVEKVFEVPHVVKREVPVRVPQVQTVEVVRQVPQEFVSQVVKEVPKVQMQYCETVVQVDPFEITVPNNSQQRASEEVASGRVHRRGGVGPHGSASVGSLTAATRRPATEYALAPGLGLPTSDKSVASQFSGRSGTAVVDVGTGAVFASSAADDWRLNRQEVATGASSMMQPKGAPVQFRGEASKRLPIGMGIGTFGDGLVSERVVGDVEQCGAAAYPRGRSYVSPNPQESAHLTASTASPSNSGYFNVLGSRSRSPSRGPMVA